MTSYNTNTIIENKYGCSITNLAVGGAGFCNNISIVDNEIVYSGVSIQKTIDNLTADYTTQYDIYVLWASTNDYWGISFNEDIIGTSDDYTEEDDYNINSRLTQCGGINYCIKKILESNENATIIIIGSLKFFSNNSDSSNGYVYDYNNNAGLFRKMVLKQKECAERFSIPFIDLWALSGINEYNNNLYMYHGENDEYYGSPAHGNDGTHPNKLGYEKIVPLIGNYISSIM